MSEDRNDAAVAILVARLAATVTPALQSRPGMPLTREIACDAVRYAALLLELSLGAALELGVAAGETGS